MPKFIKARVRATYALAHSGARASKKRIHARAANNGRSTDNVRSKLGIDRTNPWIAGHLVRSFTESFREILIFNYLIITTDNIHVSKRKQNNYKTRQISGREIPGSRKFPRSHQVVLLNKVTDCLID